MEEKSSLQKLAHLYFFGFLSYEKGSLWPGSKGVAREKHRPNYFGLRISDFFGFLFQSAFRNLQSAIWRRAQRALPNVEFGMWNSEFLLLFFHSAFRNRHSAFKWPARPEK
jgi:hypothetical protein